MRSPTKDLRDLGPPYMNNPGYVERVPPAVWHSEVSGKHVLRQWFSYRQKDRSRPIIGDRRPPLKPGEVQPDQARLLDRVCSGPLLPVADLHAHNALETRLTRPASAHRAGSARCLTLGQSGWRARDRAGARPIISCRAVARLRG